MSALPRNFWSRVVYEPTGCLTYQGCVHKSGYCRVRAEGHMTFIHRVAYKALSGPIPEGLTIDHLCMVKRCVNPLHLEAVTNSVNVARGNAARRFQIHQCKHGHAFTPENTRIRPYNGTRACRTCHRERVSRKYHEKKQAA